MFKILKNQKEAQEFLKDSLYSFGYFTDIHLNPRDPHGKAGADSVSPRFYEKIEILGNMVDFFNELPLEFVVNGGDTFHHPRIAERFKADYLNSIKKSDHPVITVIGNHDASSYDHVLSSVESWQSKELNLKEHAFVSNFSPIFLPSHDFSFYFIPYTLDINALKWPNNKVSKSAIAFMHNEITGKAPEGYPLSSYSQIKAKDLDKNIYWIFGHYHTRTQLTKNILFAGAAARNTFADSWQPGCSLFKITDKGVESLFCPVEDREYKKFPIDVKDGKNEVILKELSEHYAKEDIVHIVLTGKKDRVNTVYSFLSTTLPDCFSMTITKEPNTVFDSIKKSTDVQGISQIMEETTKQNADSKNTPILLHTGNSLLESTEHTEFMEKVHVG